MVRDDFTITEKAPTSAFNFKALEGSFNQENTVVYGFMLNANLIAELLLWLLVAQSSSE